MLQIWVVIAGFYWNELMCCCSFWVDPVANYLCWDGSLTVAAVIWFITCLLFGNLLLLREFLPQGCLKRIHLLYLIMDVVFSLSPSLLSRWNPGNSFLPSQQSFSLFLCIKSLNPTASGHQRVVAFSSVMPSSVPSRGLGAHLRKGYPLGKGIGARYRVLI